MHKGLNFCHVKFHHDLSVGLENVPRKPQNFGDNWPFASERVTRKKSMNARCRFTSVPLLQRNVSIFVAQKVKGTVRKPIRAT